MNVPIKSRTSLRYALGMAAVGAATWLTSACIVVREKPADSAVEGTPPATDPAKPADDKTDPTAKDGGTTDPVDAGPHRKPPQPVSAGDKDAGSADSGG